MQPKVSVIIAIYNCEKYIEQCARSLFEQTLKEIEYVFVNDASPDNSVGRLSRVLEDYPHRQPWVKIINLEQNGGVSNARRIGIENVTGEYVIHCDSDDWIDNDMYERLYLKAKETDADIVGCNFRHEYIDLQFDLRQKYADTMKGNIANLINGKIFPSLCTSLTRRSLITENNISFPKGLNMGEDLFFNLQLYLCAKHIIGLDWAPYHYRHTEDSSCVQRTRKSIDSDIAIAGRIESLMKEKGLYGQYAQDIEYRKFFAKLPLERNLSNDEDYNAWLTTFPETNRLIWKFAQLDWKLRTELWLATHRLRPMAMAFRNFLAFQHKLRHTR